jgi:hypothetical protein
MPRRRHARAYREAAGALERSPGVTVGTSAADDDGAAAAYDRCATCGAHIERRVVRLDYGRGRIERDLCSADGHHDLGRDPCAIRLTTTDRNEPHRLFDPRTGRWR